MRNVCYGNGKLFSVFVSNDEKNYSMPCEE